MTKTYLKEQMSNPQAQSHRDATVLSKKWESKYVRAFFKKLTRLKVWLNNWIKFVSPFDT